MKRVKRARAHYVCGEQWRILSFLIRTREVEKWPKFKKRAKTTLEAGERRLKNFYFGHVHCTKSPNYFVSRLNVCRCNIAYSIVHVQLCF